MSAKTSQERCTQAVRPDKDHTCSFMSLEVLQSSKKPLAVLTLKSFELFWGRFQTRVILLQLLAVEIHVNAVLKHELSALASPPKQVNRF